MLEAHERLLLYGESSFFTPPRGVSNLSIIELACYMRHGSKIGSQQSDRLLVEYYRDKTTSTTGVRATERIDKIKQCPRLSGAARA